MSSTPLSDRGLEQTKLRPDLDAVRRYGAAHPDVWGGEYFQWEPPPLRLVVMLAGDDTVRHEAALRRLVTLPDQLEVRRTPYSLLRLEEMRAEVKDMAQATAMGSIAGSGIGQGKLRLHLWASQEDLAAQLQERFGAAVDLTVGFLHYPDRQLLNFDGTPRQRVPPAPSPPLPSDEIELICTESLTVRSGYHLRALLQVRNRGLQDVEIKTAGAFVARIVFPDSLKVLGGYEAGLTFLPIRLPLSPGGGGDMPILIATASLVSELGYAIPPGQWAVNLNLEVTGRGRYTTPALPLTVVA